MPSFVRFLSDLFETGQVSVPVVGQETAPGFSSLRAQEILSARDEVVRLAAAGEVPLLGMETALIGAQWMYRGCQLFVDRARMPDEFNRLVKESCSELSPTPDTAHALDLTLSFLPDLKAHASLHAEDDPLMEVFNELARLWPLSAVGIPDLQPTWDRIGPWWKTASLRQRFLDRILVREAATMVNHTLVREALRASLGERAEDLAGSEVLAALVNDVRTTSL